MYILYLHKHIFVRGGGGLFTVPVYCNFYLVIQFNIDIVTYKLMQN
jgi:hypothetical protein